MKIEETYGNSQLGKGAVVGLKIRKTQCAPAEVSAASSSNQSVNAVSGEQLGNCDKAWHSTLSGGALNLPDLETNDCPLPNLRITVRLFQFSHRLYRAVVLIS